MRADPAKNDIEQTAAAAEELGGGTYRALYERFGFELAGIGSRCERFLAETEDHYVAAFDRLLRARFGLGIDDVRRSDMPRLLRGTAWDEGFPASAMLPALETTLGDLGIDLRGQRNVHLDMERRPTKTPRAYCFPIRVPGHVVLMIQPIGGLDDWNALFHEAGHTEHFAHASPRLPFEARRLGDDAVTEGWAFLLEHLVSDPAWLTRRLDFGRPEVRNFLVANALYWLQEYHVDGLRVDAVASMLYLDYSRPEGGWTPNIYGGRENLEAVQFLQEMNATVHKVTPGIVTIAEEGPTSPRRSAIAARASCCFLRSTVVRTCRPPSRTVLAPYSLISSSLT